jgi:hypothetical protein
MAATDRRQGYVGRERTQGTQERRAEEYRKSADNLIANQSRFALHSLASFAPSARGSWVLSLWLARAAHRDEVDPI